RADRISLGNRRTAGKGRRKIPDKIGRDRWTGAGRSAVSDPSVGPSSPPPGRAPPLTSHLSRFQVPLRPTQKMVASVLSEMNYKETLNLPKTDFPMKANLTTREPEILAKWESNGLYEQIQERTKDGPLFVLHDGPPFANGDVHMGTALNKVLKDLIVKSRAMAGYRAPYVPGWDCHGLPIEFKVV